MRINRKTTHMLVLAMALLVTNCKSKQDSMLDDAKEFQALIEDSTNKEGNGLKLLELGPALNKKYPARSPLGEDTLRRVFMQKEPSLTVPPKTIGKYSLINWNTSNFYERDWYSSNGFKIGDGDDIPYYHGFASYWDKSKVYINVTVEDKGYLPAWQLSLLYNNILKSEKKVTSEKKDYETVNYQNHAWRVLYDPETQQPKKYFTIWGNQLVITISQVGFIIDPNPMIGPEFAFKALRTDWLNKLRSSED